MPKLDPESLPQTLIALQHEDSSRFVDVARSIVGDQDLRFRLLRDSFNLLRSADDKLAMDILQMLAVFASPCREFRDEPMQNEILGLFERRFTDDHLAMLSNAVRAKAANDATLRLSMDLLLQILSTLRNMKSNKGFILTRKVANLFEGTIIRQYLLDELAFCDSDERSR